MVSIIIMATNKESVVDTSIMDSNFDYMYKILVVGDHEVGKTAFCERYLGNTFPLSYISTVGIDFNVKDITRDDKRIKLQIWDTAGQERYRNITTAYYRGAMGFILVFDLTNEESFQAVKGFVIKIKKLFLDNIQLVLVGNKSDLSESRVVSKDQGMELAEELQTDYFETSVKDSINVDHVFEYLIKLISTKMSKLANNEP